ncbi:MAG: carotenoid oxygenase family protein [Labedaea sp.]
MVTTTRRASTKARVPAFAKVNHSPEALSVTGTIPAELNGCLLRAVDHPAWGAAPRPGTPLVDGGIRLSGGVARWYRQTTPPCGNSATWRAARLRSGDPRAGAHGPASLARPVTDPVTGVWHTVATYPGLNHAEHLWLGADGSVRHAEPFPLDGAPLMQAVAMTERYLVVLDLPVTHRRAAALLGEGFPYAWDDGRPARIGLIGRDEERPRWFSVPSCYVFDVVNAYDDRDRVVLDAVRHERAFDQAGGTPAARLWRWTVDLRTGTVREGELDRLPIEQPEVDPRVRGRRHRVVFGIGNSAAGEATTLVRHDLAGAATQVRELGPAKRAEQPVLVPGAAEGTGWLIAVVHDMAKARSEVLVLDAADLSARPVATVHVPFRLPVSRHTWWRQ